MHFFVYLHRLFQQSSFHSDDPVFLQFFLISVVTPLFDCPTVTTCLQVIRTSHLSLSWALKFFPTIFLETNKDIFTRSAGYSLYSKKYIYMKREREKKLSSRLLLLFYWIGHPHAEPVHCSPSPFYHCSIFFNEPKRLTSRATQPQQ